jgi:phosphoglycerate dehydrogenase-like enzyme
MEPAAPEVTRRVTADRPISPAEITLIHAMLERAAVDPVYRRLAAGIESLRVIARCSCGCDSVDFNDGGQERHPTPIADATGETAAGGTVGVLIWGTAASVAGIEVYDLGAGPDDIRLPLPQSIRPW